jgi:hypothetical protein
LQRSSSSSWMQRTQAGLPVGANKQGDHMAEAFG